MPNPSPLKPANAMSSKPAGNTSVIALWLGHEKPDTTRRIYLHADLSIKERALARTMPLHTKPGRYRLADQLLAFLDSL
jgi:integrase/recombinase XerD